MIEHLPSKILRRYDLPIFERLVDRRTWTKPQPLRKLRQLARRYRSAGRGSALTDNERTLLELHNAHRGERVFILGNGPSLNLLDLTKLQREHTFGVNGIFLNRDTMGFDPTYYVVEDTFVAEDRAERINAYHGPKHQFFGNYLDYCLIDKPENVWLNVRLDYRDYPGFPHFSTNAAREVWVGGSVTYICLQLAYWMGFSEVYMIGFDHNYVIPKDAEISNRRESGYDIVSQSDDPNHFHPDYFGKGFRWHEPRVERMELGFKRARETFAADGRRVYNATAGGHLNVFERVDYASLFS